MLGAEFHIDSLTSGINVSVPGFLLKMRFIASAFSCFTITDVVAK
ncbi:hypothetical protein BN133_919 [Cronobacter dublinensis 582]|nr:hypothetical protein BN133_919 [Cronobacter dublinensis 582]